MLLRTSEPCSTLLQPPRRSFLSCVFISRPPLPVHVLLWTLLPKNPLDVVKGASQPPWKVTQKVKGQRGPLSYFLFVTKLTVGTRRRRNARESRKIDRGATSEPDLQPTFLQCLRSTRLTFLSPILHLYAHLSKKQLQHTSVAFHTTQHNQPFNGYPVRAALVNYLYTLTYPLSLFQNLCS